MAGSLLGSFVSGTRQMLAIQLFVSVGAVALAGWTLTVTNELIQERDQLRDRVIQLEQTMAQNNIVPPEARPVIEDAPSSEGPYPPEAVLPEDGELPEDQLPNGDAPLPQDPIEPGGTETPGQTVEPGGQTAEPQTPTFDPGAVIDIFRRPPPLRTVVLHVRTREEYALARRIAADLTESSRGELRVPVVITRAGEAHQPGYAYFDGRQSRPAAAMVARFNDVARQYQIAQWSAQLRGRALPAQGEYTADRVDIVLPALQQTPTLQIDPRILQEQRVNPQLEQARPPVRDPVQ